MGLLFDTGLSQKFSYNSSQQSTYAPQFSSVSTTTDARVVTLNLNSPYASGGSSSPSTTPSLSASLTPTLTSGQIGSATSQTDKTAQYILIGGAILGVAFLVMGNKSTKK